MTLGDLSRGPCRALLAWGAWGGDGLRDGLKRGIRASLWATCGQPQADHPEGPRRDPAVGPGRLRPQRQRP